MAYAFNDDKSKFDLDTIAGNMATIETSPVVSNHSKGEYIIYENVLYEVISPIASGESLVLGTNVRSINIGDQLKAFQDSVGWTVLNVTGTSTTIGANTGKTTSYGVNAPSGYKAVGVVGYNLAHGELYLSHVKLNGAGTAVWVYITNTSDNSITTTPLFDILCLKTQ